MSLPPLNAPLSFIPLYFSRIWGGRGLETRFGRTLPIPKDSQDVKESSLPEPITEPVANPIGEAWDIVDREDHVSRLVSPEGKDSISLHELWTRYRDIVFGSGYDHLPRFPILCKVLDAQDDLSVQVHPSQANASELGGEPKAELWYVTHAEPGAKLYAGWKSPVTRAQVEEALDTTSLPDLIATFYPEPGESIFIPGGRIHALGAGLTILEIQENSDTTYRLYDWDRTDAEGHKRELHLGSSLSCISYDDTPAGLHKPSPGILTSNPSFTTEEIHLSSNDPIGLDDPSHFALLTIARGRLAWGDLSYPAGTTLLAPAHIPPGIALDDHTIILRTTVPPLDK